MRLLARLTAAGLLFALAAATTAGATQKQIDDAIRKGVAYLKERFKGGAAVGGGGGGHGIGPPALGGLALLQAGVPAGDPTVAAIAAAVRNRAYQETQTYQLSLCLLFLDQLSDPADVPLIQMLAIRLLIGQTPGGGWDYACIGSVPEADEQRLRAGLRNAQLVAGGPGGAPKLHPEVEKYAQHLARNKAAGVGVNDAVVGGGGDNSNTQFGLLAVWAARKHGVYVDPALDLIDKRFLTTQSPQSGGWDYNGAGTGSPSMICAGLLGLATGLARREEKRLKADVPKKDPPKDAGKADPAKANDPFFNPPARPGGDKDAPKANDPKRPPDARDLAIQRGFAGLGGFLADAQRQGGIVNPRGNLGNRDLYFLWSLERVGVVYGADKIGGLDWYEAGADLLVRSQSPDGSWSLGSYDAEINTAFAVLFLTKSNIVRDLSSRVKNESTTELRAGAGGTTEGAPKKPGGPANPDAEVPRPVLPLPKDDPAAKLAAALIQTPAADWAKALEKTRDAKGAENTRALVLTIPRVGGEKKTQAREALAERLCRMTPDTLRGMMTADDPELRRGAVLAAAMKEDTAHVADLIDRLADDDDLVVRAARAALKSLTGQDFGPANGATPEQRKTAADAWRAWWAKQKK